MITNGINRFGVNDARTPGNDPKQFAPTRCKVLKPFGLGAGHVAEVGKTVELPRFDAYSLAATGKVLILE